MNKIAALLLALCTIFTLAACNVVLLPEVESTDTESEILTELKPEVSTEIPEPVFTEPSTEIPNAPSDDPDASETQALAMQAYWAALNGDGELILKDYGAPYMGTPLRELDSIRYAFVDLGGDGVDELVIDCGDTLILRYYEGNLYSYEFTFRNLYYLTTDGSHSWNHTGSDFVYGQSQFFFEGKEIRSKELWRIVNDGEPNAEYYIEGKQVLQSEILQYFEEHPKTNVTFSTFEAPWKNPVSSGEAYQLAKLYWKDFEIGANGYVVDRGVNDRAPLDVYVFLLRGWVEGHYTTFDEIWIDVNTGEVIIPYFLDGK